LTIFDWDDTLFPTTSFNPMHEGDFQRLFRKNKKLLASLDFKIVDLLKHACNFSKVIIVTNAVKYWVELSSRDLMP